MTILILYIVYDLSRIGIHIPLAYSVDGLFSGESVKSILETGWYLFNPNVGVPFGQYMVAFPNSDGLCFLLIRMIGLFTDDWVVAINIFYFLTYVLSAFTSFWAMRNMGVSRGSAFVFSLLFAFLPFHLMYSEYHLYLGAYFAIPLVVFIVHEILSLECHSEIHKLPKTRFLIIIGLIASSTGVYYAFFSGAILCFALVYQIVLVKSFRYSKPIYILLSVIVAGFLINVSPTLKYLLTQSHNVLTLRSPAEVEIYGLKIIQMLLPRRDGSFHFWRNFNDNYCNIMPLINGNIGESLGLWGSFGFILGLIVVFFVHKNGWVDSLRNLAKVNLFIILLATVGGFGSLIAMLGFSEIRAYHRIARFIAFISLFSTAAFFTYLLNKLKHGWKSKLVALIILLAAMLVGLMDQVNFPEINAVDLQRAFMTDQSYFSSLQLIVPKKASVLQLPYVPFPEFPPVVGMKDYDQFRPYLHTKGIRWSYGVMKGTHGDEVIKALSFLSPQNIVNMSQILGYSGVLINTLGYKDSGVAIVKDFQSVLGQAGIDGAGFVYFPFPYKSSVESQTIALDQRVNAFKAFLLAIHTGQNISFRSQDLKYQGSILSFLRSGFSRPEEWGVWSEGSASTMLFFADHPQSNVKLIFNVSPYLPKPGMVLSVEVKANGTKVADWLFKNGGTYPSAETVDVPINLIPEDGKLSITFEYSKTNSPANLGISTDSRQFALYFNSVTRK